MSDYSVTISIGFSVVGVEPPTLWNSGNWNAIIWGSSGDWGTHVLKGIANSITPDTTLAFQTLIGITNALSPDTAMGFGAYHLIENDLTPTSDMGMNAQIGIDNTLTPDADMGAEYLLDAAGYSYVFPSNTTDAEGRDDPTWSDGTASAASWTASALASTNWS